MSKTTNPYNRVHPNDPIHNSELGTQDGLTKREYFAAMTLQGLLADGHYASAVVTKRAVDLADELIKSLNEGGDNE